MHFDGSLCQLETHFALAICHVPPQTNSPWFFNNTANAFLLAVHTGTMASCSCAFVAPSITGKVTVGMPSKMLWNNERKFSKLNSDEKYWNLSFQQYTLPWYYSSARHSLPSSCLRPKWHQPSVCVQLHWPTWTNMALGRHKHWKKIIFQWISQQLKKISYGEFTNLLDFFCIAVDLAHINHTAKLGAHVWWQIKYFPTEKCKWMKQKKVNKWWG